jgi:hypothetical protein
MKIIFNLTFFLALGVVHAQHSFSSYQFHIYNLESEEVVGSEEKNQTFNVSFTDSLLIHNIFNEEHHISDSQIYRITRIEEKENMTMFSALSGVSGNTYYYVMNIKGDETTLVQLFQEDNSMYVFDAEHSRMKTFNQP